MDNTVDESCPITDLATTLSLSSVTAPKGSIFDPLLNQQEVACRNITVEDILDSEVDWKSGVFYWQLSRGPSPGGNDGRPGLPRKRPGQDATENLRCGTC